MWKNYLKNIENEQKKYGESINMGLSDYLASQIMDLPVSFINFLEEVNGLEYNGYIIYGINDPAVVCLQPVYDIYEYNEIWHENDEMRRYLFIGESNLSWYVYDTKSEIYAELDNPSGRLINSFDTLDLLLSQVLQEALEN